MVCCGNSWADEENALIMRLTQRTKTEFITHTNFNYTDKSESGKTVSHFSQEQRDATCGNSTLCQILKNDGEYSVVRARKAISVINERGKNPLKNDETKATERAANLKLVWEINKWLPLVMSA